MLLFQTLSIYSLYLEASNLFSISFHNPLKLVIAILTVLLVHILKIYLVSVKVILYSNALAMLSIFSTLLKHLI